MTRLISIAAHAIEDKPDKEHLLSAAAILDDAMMTIYDNNTEYYNKVITQLQIVLKKSTSE